MRHWTSCRRNDIPRYALTGIQDVWITILAYHLLRWTEYSLKLAGIECTWQEVRRLLQTHCYATVKLPCKNGKEYQIRKPGIPDEKQKLIYKALNIDVGALPVTRRVVEPIKEAH